MSLNRLWWPVVTVGLCLSFANDASAQLMATTAVSGVSCNGGRNGAASVTPFGGTAPYQYAWSPIGVTAAAASGLVAGDYTVTITDANQSVITKPITISEPPALVLTAQKTDVVGLGMANGSATIEVSGGTPGYTYSWSPTGGTAATAANLVAGTYAVSVTDGNDCQTTRLITVSEAAVPVVINAVAVPASGLYGPGGDLDFTINFSHAVTVDTTGGTPALAIDIGGRTVSANFLSGSGTTALVFRYTVMPGDIDANGITVAPFLALNGGTLKADGVNPDLSMPSLGSTAGVLVGSPEIVAVPTLTQWAMILLASLLALFGLATLGHRRCAPLP